MLIMVVHDQQCATAKCASWIAAMAADPYFECNLGHKLLRNFFVFWLLQQIAT
jgi:hypothetical protein